MRKLVPLLAAALVTAATATAAGPPKGHLVLIGGGDKPDAAMRRFVELAGGPNAPILVFPTASADPDTGPFLERQLEEEFGCKDVTVLEVRTCEDAHRPDYVQLADLAGGFFFSGGDQSRIIAAFQDSPLYEAVLRSFTRGAVIGGTSAGTACQSPLMITGEGNFDVITAENVELWPGLGFFEGVIVDQHFIERRRHNRLISVILEHSELLGVGVGEDAAVWVRPDRTFEVIGAGWVMVLDAAGARVTRSPGADGKQLLGVHDLRVHVLLEGEQYDLKTRAVLPRAAESR
jgi:cyanophycinase